MRATRRGFTLVELMIVIAIISILAAVVFPKFADMVRRSNEGASKGNLAAMRSALTVYYGNMDGQYPATLSSLSIGGQILTAIAKTPNYHGDSSAELDALLSAPDDSGGWLYNNVATDANYGAMAVNCTHTDTNGSVWTSY